MFLALVSSHFNHVWLFGTLWTVGNQAHLSIGFSRQSYGVGHHLLLQGIFRTQGSKPGLLHYRHSLPSEPPGKPILLLAKTEMGFPDGSDCYGVRLRCGRPGFSPWVGKIPWRRVWKSTLVLLPGESQGQRSLAGDSPWGCRVGQQDLNSFVFSPLEYF